MALPARQKISSLRKKNQRIVLQISFSNSTFPSKSIKKEMFFILDITQVTFVTVPIVVLPTASFSSQGMGGEQIRPHMSRFLFCVPTDS